VVRLCKIAPGSQEMALNDPAEHAPGSPDTPAAVRDKTGGQDPLRRPDALRVLWPPAPVS